MSGEPYQVMWGKLKAILEAEYAEAINWVDQQDPGDAYAVNNWRDRATMLFSVLAHMKELEGKACQRPFGANPVQMDK